MRPIRPLLVGLAVVLLASSARAQTQTLTLSLFERYLDVLREQALIPGISAAVIQNGVVVWERGLGRQDFESTAPPTADTPYPIGGLTQIISSTLLLQKCADEGSLSVNDPVQEWSSDYPDAGVTVTQLLTHAAPAGGFRFDLTRFAALTSVMESCTGTEYRRLLATDVFERFAMRSSAPGAAFLTPTPGDWMQFTPAEIARFADVARRVAPAYRIDPNRGRPVRSDVPPTPISAASGIITTLGDLERFDLALRAGALMTPERLRTAWTPATIGAVQMPTGLGWFVQRYQGEPLVWQFGVIRDAYSSLILKLPNRDLTLILLANSDALAGPFVAPPATAMAANVPPGTSVSILEQGDVTANLFARLFLRFAVPSTP